MTRHLTRPTAQAPSPRTLDSLARTANREHEKATASARIAIEHAVRAGEALAKARELCDVGEWGEFIESRFEGSLRTAQRYMRLANNWRRLDQAAPQEAFASQRKAVIALTNILSGDDQTPAEALFGARRDARVASRKKASPGNDARVASPQDISEPRDARVASRKKASPGSDARVASPQNISEPRDARVASLEEGLTLAGDILNRGVAAVNRTIADLRSHTPVTYHVAAALRSVESLRAEFLECLASASAQRAKLPQAMQASQAFEAFEAPDEPEDL